MRSRGVAGLSGVVPNRLGTAGATAMAAALQHVTGLLHLNLRCAAQPNNPTDPLSNFIYSSSVPSSWYSLKPAA